MVNYNKYIDHNELKQRLLYKRITEWDEDYLKLEDGTKLTLETTEQDCCAWADGEFKDVVLDAMITDVKLGEEKVLRDGNDDFGEITNQNSLTIFHNQNPIAVAEMTADAGNGGYYYSVGSLVFKDVHFNDEAYFKIVEA